MLASNLTHFARLLRRAGLPVGPADVLVAAQALAAVRLDQRAQVRAALAATLTHRHEHRELFDEAFRLFWRDPEAVPATADPAQSLPTAVEPFQRRLAEAVAALRERPPAGESERDSGTVSARERLRAMDFEAMGAAEIARAKAEIARLTLPLDLRRTRRRRRDPHGPRADLRATLRASLRTGGEIAAVSRTRAAVRPPPLVALCDISGSMARYSQLLVHFLHALANDRDRVSVFLFGTRLSNVTRQLRHRDAEVALEAVGRAVPDWSGGTRIGEALGRFNRDWARRVLGQGAVVLLVTDGLDRDGAAGLSESMERLHKSCARLVWLNPLLRWDGFAPKSQGVRAMLPHVDEFRTVHNLDSLAALVASLSRAVEPREMEKWRMM